MSRPLGSVRPLKGGGYLVQVSYYVGGKQKRKTRRVQGRLRDAETAKLEMLRLLENPGQVVTTSVNSSMTFGAFLESKWIPFVHRKVGENDSPSTAMATESRLRLHVLPYRIASMACSELDCLKMDDWMGELRKARPDLKERTLSHIYANVRTACRQAVAWKLIPMDPTAGMGDKPHPRSYEAHMLTLAEANQLMAAFVDHELGLGFVLVLGLGLRPGEVCALRWADFDLEAGRIHVSRNIVPLSAGMGGGIKECRVKTQSSVRTVVIPPQLMALVQAHRLRRMEERLVFGKPEALIISRPNGGPVRPNYLSRRFTAARKALGLPDVRLYDLRHAFGRYMLKGGVDLHTVSKALGHSRISTTSHYYLDDDADLRQAAANTLGAIILPSREARG